MYAEITVLEGRISLVIDAAECDALAAEDME